MATEESLEAVVVTRRRRNERLSVRRLLAVEEADWAVHRRRKAAGGTPSFVRRCG